MESAELAHELDQAGYTQATAEDGPADVVVINTCAVTGKSAASARAAIRAARADNPAARVVVTGCYSETSPDDVASVEGVDLVLGNAEKFSMTQALRKLDNHPEGEALVLVAHGAMPERLPVRPVTGMSGRTNAYLNVQSGCDEVCSFCVVRIARGKSRSASAAELVEQVQRLSDAGIKEVVLSGINIGQYSDGDTDLATLLEAVLIRTDITRVRLSSINPNNVTQRLIDLMALESRFCSHLHIPLQNGSDRILRLMRRPYTSVMYEDLLNRLAERIEGIGLGADVMTGFPGETDEDFGMTRSLVERLPLMMMHVFSYSSRAGTEACSMPGAVVRARAKERTAELKAISDMKRREFISAHEGKELDVLVESSRTAGGKLKGFTANYIPAVFEGPDDMSNSMVRVTGWRAKEGALECRLSGGA